MKPPGAGTLDLTLELTTEMPIRRQNKSISDPDLEALFARFEAGTIVKDDKTIQFVHLDHDELERILPDAFEAAPAFTRRQLRYLLREALWNCRKQDRLTIDQFVEEARNIARSRLAVPTQSFAMWTKFRAKRMNFSESFRLQWEDVELESTASLPAYMNHPEYFLSGHGRMDPLQPAFYGYLIAKCEGRDEESAFAKMQDAIDIFMALFNMYEAWGRWTIGSINLEEGKLWNGPYHFLFRGEHFLGEEALWYDPDFSEEAWNRFPLDMKEVLKLVPHVQHKLEVLSNHSLRELLLRVLRLMQNAMRSRDQSYALLRYWSALEQLYGDPSARDKNYSRIIKRATFAERDKLIARWKLSHISRLRNEYVHSGDSDDDLRTMSHHLRRLLSLHVNYLMLHASDVQTHGQWLEIVDLPDDQPLLEARKANIDRRIAIIRQGSETE